VIVNWNSLSFLKVTLAAIRRFTDPEVEVIVVDNGSTDGSREFLVGSGARRILLPINIHHGYALDIGVALATTEFVVTLDVDAFPIDAQWVERLLAPLHSGCHVSGVLMKRQYAHPSCLAIRQRRFMARSYSFAPIAGPRSHDKFIDVGEAISTAEGKEFVHLIEPTSRFGKGNLGLVYSGIVYHNVFSTRHEFEFPGDPDGALEQSEVTRTDVARAWEAAVRTYLNVPGTEASPSSSRHDD
jgi:glycosyltransferase involved in cell wall biosynthesis